MAALGAAYLGGLGVGFWKNQEEISAMWKMDKFLSLRWILVKEKDLSRLESVERFYVGLNKHTDNLK